MELLIFDCDGVLVDTEIIAAEVMIELLKTYGFDTDMEYYINNFTGKTFTGILDDLDIKFDKNLEELSKQTEQKIYARLRAIDGMGTLVKSQSLPTAIVSNSATWQVEKAIQFLHLENHIKDNYFSSEMVERPKPFPDIYLRAAADNKVKVNDCLVIEDSLSGATAALKAGMTVIGFAGASHIRTGHGQKLMDLGVIAVAKTPAELSKIIEETTLAI